MKSLSLCFQVHQPVRLKKFRFFDIGKSDYYYDDPNNERIIRRISKSCYLPSNKMMLELIKKHEGRFRIAFSISGTAIDQFRLYAPEVIDSFRELAETGCVEFLAGTYPHSFIALKNKEKFRKQVEAHSKVIETLFGKKPSVFRNTDLIYSDEIGVMVAEMGYKAILSMGPENILKWRSPNYLYSNKFSPQLKVLLKNHRLSDDIAERFSDSAWCGWPLTAKKYVSWLTKTPKEEEIINLMMDYETFGERHTHESGIFEFMASLPSVILSKSDLEFRTPSEVAEKYQPVSAIDMPFPVSQSNEEGNLSAWLGNEIQQEAFRKLYELDTMIDRCNDPDLLTDWQYLQTSDHFSYMSTKYFNEGNTHANFNPYENPYEAFMNYMNVLNDFSIRLSQNVEKNMDFGSGARNWQRSFNYSCGHSA